MTKETKKCTKCGEVKGLECFNKSKNARDGLQSQCKVCKKEYQRENKERAREYKRKWRDKNKEYLKEYLQANKEYKKEYDRKYRKENIERIKEYEKERSGKWRKENPDKNRAKSAKRRSRKLRATPEWLTEEQDLQIKLIYEEAIELEKADGIKRHVDHIVPLQGKNVCGLHVPWNLQILTAEQNLRKSNKH